MIVYLIGSLAAAFLTFIATIVYMRKNDEKIDNDTLVNLYLILLWGAFFSWVAVIIATGYILMTIYENHIIAFMNNLIKKGKEND